MINELVKKYIQTDGDYSEYQNNRIISIYESLDSDAKSQVDDIFIALCGYSLGTIIKVEVSEVEL